MILRHPLGYFKLPQGRVIGRAQNTGGRSSAYLASPAGPPGGGDTAMVELKNYGPSVLSTCSIGYLISFLSYFILCLLYYPRTPSHLCFRSCFPTLPKNGSSDKLSSIEAASSPELALHICLCLFLEERCTGCITVYKKNFQFIVILT